jgi:outer membrane receptor protein involved in Fe transport
MLVQVDGYRVNEADTGNTDWALMPLDEIESIEIVRGPASALYGDNAVGGVINIRTRPHEGPPRVTVRGRVGRYETGGENLKAAGTLGPVTGSLFVDGFTTDGYRHGADFEHFQGHGSLQAAVGERVLLGASGGGYHDDRDFPGALTQRQIDDLGRRARDPSTESQGAEVESYFVRAWIEALLAEGVELRVRQQGRWRDDDSTLSFGDGIGTFSGDTEKTSVGVDGQIQVDRPVFGLRNRLIAGFDFARDETDRVDVFDSEFDLFDARTSSDNEKNVYAAFLQEELNLSEELLLSAGVRFDRAAYEIFILDDALGSAAANPHFEIWSPKAALTWRLLPTASVYFSYSRGFRLPNFDESSPILSFTPGDPPIVPDLEPQISNSFELGGKWRGERVDASLAFYWMKVKNEITLNPLLGVFGANDNFDRVRHRGMEASIAVRILECLLLHADYTYEDVLVTSKDEPGLDGARMPMTPKHRGGLGVLATLPYDLEFAANALFVDGRIVSNDFDRQAAKLGRYETLDLLLAWRPSFGEHFEGALTLAFRNVTGEKYHGLAVRSTIDPSRVVFYPAAGRTWEVGFMLTFRK